ncbi:MAG: geopeptide radical SAM maturase [Deltaproteobacteria bacterium]|nr:geopeptide radical SAM maturase [Deltaproteobacteria bacterium]
MFLSHYARIFSWPDDTELRLVYSTRTGAKALVPAAVLAAIESNSLDSESEATLHELGLLVNDREREMADAADMVRQINSLRRVMNISVIANLHCNFRCRYCYEGSQKGRSIMSAGTADQLIAFIRQRFQPDMTRLTLDFYGGEPLLSTPLLRHIAGSLKPWVESQGAEFEITLVSNGSLLTPRVVERLLPAGLKRAKITIDGPPNNHNFFRPYRSGRASFATIMKNMGQCADLVKLAINGNFTKDNYQKFPALFDSLTAYGLTPARVYRLTFSPVMQTTDEFSTDFCGGCASCSEKWLTHAAPFLYQEIVQRGYRTDKISPSLCMVDVDNSFVVHYDGTLYQCVAMIGHKEYACGDVWSGLREYRQQYHLDHWQKEEKCRQCPYLPLCFGGCRFMAFQRDGHMAAVDCRKPFYDATLEALLLQELRYREGNQGAEFRSQNSGVQEPGVGITMDSGLRFACQE